MPGYKWRLGRLCQLPVVKTYDHSFKVHKDIVAKYRFSSESRAFDTIISGTIEGVISVNLK